MLEMSLGMLSNPLLFMDISMIGQPFGVAQGYTNLRYETPTAVCLDDIGILKRGLISQSSKSGFSMI